MSPFQGHLVLNCGACGVSVLGSVNLVLGGEASVADWLDHEDLEELVKPLETEMLAFSNTEHAVER